jgi:hypothetical protein
MEEEGEERKRKKEGRKEATKEQYEISCLIS